MQCPRCHAENRDGRRFCGECGLSLALVCASCGFANEGSEKFCGGCGAPVAGSTAVPAGKLGPPETYTPRHLPEKILTLKSALEGERKQVTVLFADLKGSMEMLADRDPEEARKLLDPVLEHMMEAVHRYEGTVNQVMGDGIMALFGAPLAHEDHAVRACYAALRMQESVRRYADGVRREHAVTVHIRVGLNSGEVVVRAIGSDLHMDYTAVGQTTHLAARMEQLAGPGSILLTPGTLALAEGFVQVAALGPVAVKGLPGPVEVFELTGVSAVRSRLQAAAARGLSRFVGRDAEVEQLYRALDQARQGHGQVAAIVGETGVGKSRLVFELTHSHRVDGWLVVEAGSVSYGKATSYLPVIDLLKGYFRIGDRDTPREIQEKTMGKILTLDRALEPTLPALLALLDVPADDPQWQALDPPQRRQRTLDSVKRLLLREAQIQPLLVVFEDLHWIDSETQALLDSLIESLPVVRLLLLVNYRPEYSHSWGNKTFYTQLRLNMLPPETAGELFDALLGPDASLDPLKTLLAGKTGGNPLFIEESVRAMVETRALLGGRGAYRLAQPVETVQVPATVQAILASRIDRLLPEEKRLLEIAAAIGKDFPFPLLQAVADENEETLRRALGHLQTAEFLYETSLFPDLEFTFKHALTHEVAYGSLLHDRRRNLHARIAEAMERLYADRLTEQVERLAQHALRGEQWEKAVGLYQQAGAKAVARSAEREAAESFERALTALGHCPDGRGARELSVDIRCDLQGPLVGLGELTRMRDHLQQAEDVASALDDQARLGRVSAHMTTCFWWMGEHEKAVEAGRRAQAIASSIGDFELQVLSNFRLGQAYFYLGDFRTSGRSVPTERGGTARRPSGQGVRNARASGGRFASFPRYALYVPGRLRARVGADGGGSPHRGGGRPPLQPLLRLLRAGGCPRLPGEARPRAPLVGAEPRSLPRGELRVPVPRPLDLAGTRLGLHGPDPRGPSPAGSSGSPSGLDEDWKFWGAGGERPRRSLYGRRTGGRRDGIRSRRSTTCSRAARACRGEHCLVAPRRDLLALTDRGARAGRGIVPRGPDARRSTRPSAADSEVPPGGGQALSKKRRPTGGPRTAIHRDEDVS